MPIIKKAIKQAGGSDKPSTAIGFNTPSSIQKLQPYTNYPLIVEDGVNLGVNGVARVRPSFLSFYNAYTSSFFLPQTILTGHVAAKMYSLDAEDRAFGIIVRAGGDVKLWGEGGLHDGIKLNIKNSGYYSVFKYEHGQEEIIIPWTYNPAVVKMNDWNILMATTGGKTVKFYVNGNFVGQHSSNRLIYGAPGFYFTTSSERTGFSKSYIDWIVTKINATSDGYK